ncbi:MAG: hypothetical protein JST10_12595 [Bacteroidetes bacterium]|nr:hypothetical protein [Bacteroidota bacterium]MBS1633399.1 hypothetical protein [Bacteroidota bacterium]
MKSAILAIIISSILSCTGTKRIHPIATGIKERTSFLTGNEFYHKAFAMKWQDRDSFVLKEALAGDIPSFLTKFVAIHTSITDSATGKKISATYYVAPDYLSIGTDKDWARINITPKAAQKIADSMGCFLPTRKMVDDIYRAAGIKLEPIPMYAFRDSTPTMWQHHLIIEGQRRGRRAFQPGRRGLIAGIQKDVVISGKISRDPKPDRVAIYGWHKPDGMPIQPLYTGHVFWWVDYSQGIRLVYRKIKVGKKWMDYTEVLKDPVLQRLLCDEEFCDFYRYSY